MMREQLSQGADPNARNKATRSALAVACLGNNPDAVRVLLEAGADADGRISLEDERINGQHYHHDDTPLMIAAGRDNRKVHSLTARLMRA